MNPWDFLHEFAQEDRSDDGTCCPCSYIPEIGRITFQMVKHAPTFAEAMDPILRILQNSIVVAHNARFEENFLVSEFRSAGVSLPLLPAIDTLWLARQILNLENYKLDTVIASYRERIDEAHTALGDVRAMAKVLPRMFESSPKVFFPVPFSELPRIDTTFKAKPR